MIYALRLAAQSNQKLRLAFQLGQLNWRANLIGAPYDSKQSSELLSAAHEGACPTPCGPWSSLAGHTQARTVRDAHERRFGIARPAPLVALGRSLAYSTGVKDGRCDA